jgi:hypothetical protein
LALPKDQAADLRPAVRAELDQLLSSNVKEAAVRSTLGEINFAEAVPLIERVLSLFGMLKDASLDYVSVTRLNELRQSISEASGLFKQIEAFTLTVDNPRAQRDSIINNLMNQYHTWFDRIYALIGFAIRSTTDFAALEQNLREKIAQAEVTSRELLSKSEDTATRADETLAAIQKAAAEAGVSQEAVHFKTEADQQETLSKSWLIATIAVAAGTVGWGLLVLFALTIPDKATTPQLVQQTVGKVIVFVALYYALLWCARNYNAARHNFIVNRHRQNALSTFETFVKAAGSEDVKQAILMQATTSIFASQPSGYAGKDGESEQPSKVIEILRSVGSATKAGPT